MASVRLEMAFIWSSELAERPLAASARRMLSCHDFCAFGAVLRPQIQHNKTELACIDTLGSSTHVAWKHSIFNIRVSLDAYEQQRSQEEITSFVK